VISPVKDFSLKNKNTWLVGGKADWYFEPTSIAQLIEAQKWAQSKQLNITILGSGSNCLISDQGVEGLVIGMSQLKDRNIKIEKNILYIHAQSGVQKSELLKIFLKYKLAPALFLAGIPGDVGGGVSMNAGIAEMYIPREFGELVSSVSVLKPDHQIVSYNHDSIEWKYRHTMGWQPGIICEAVLRWPIIEVQDILTKVRDANRLRLSKQPLDMPSCGSVFINPTGTLMKAAQLIDKAGFKGRQIGGAQISSKHANFIVNTGNATAQDMADLIRLAQSEVKAQFGIELNSEVVWMGRW
jgi:UDP-N-acetylmuramate dehydrogenase